ncbi:MAG TPA: hypothetical protein PLT47_04650 [Bacteroidales bacterium]|nr:hypothetical protein [Bacteroidales bacterium]HQI70016.1 hypothetical protein [Bacteroidales bacterium]
MKINFVYTIGKVTLFTIICCSFVCGKAQEIIIPERCDSVYYVTILDSLKKNYPHCIDIPQEYELAFFTAVAHYPELKDINITMKLESFNYTMAARPAKKLLSNRRNRIYCVYANIKNNFSGIVPSRLKYNQKVGVIGHELAHILDYTNKSLCGIIKTGVGYLSLNYRKKLEAATDLEAIKHGLGWPLFDYNHYIMNHPDATEKYKKKKARVYLNEVEIKKLIIDNSK